MNRQDAKDAKETARIEPCERLDWLAYAVIGAALEVHRRLGPGYLESVYEEAMSVELNLRGIPFERQKPVVVFYKGYEIGERRLDFLIDNDLVVELKAVDSLVPVHKAQVISYLKTTRCRLGVLINFNVPLIRDGVWRVVLS